MHTRHSETVSSPQTLKGRFYYPELDAIRFFLFLGVWSYHALPREESFYTQHHLPTALARLITGVINAGMCSLDVFFILSAFLITELLLRERELTGTADLKSFYIRRLLRIWPLYFFMIALAGLISLFDRSQVLGNGYALAFLLFAGNWIIILKGFPAASIIVPLWSVSFEEQFYLVWPLVLRRASRTTIYGIAIGLFAVAASARLMLLLRHSGFLSLWFNSFVRLDSIAFGILLALLFHGRPTFRVGGRVRLALFVAGMSAWCLVGSYCGMLNLIPPLKGSMLGYPLMSFAGVAVFLSVLGASEDGAPFMKHSGLVYLGKISYGLYAYHFLASRISYYLFRDHAHAFRLTLSAICALAITLLLAVVSFRWLESPFLRLKQKKFTYVPSGPAIETTKMPLSEDLREGLRADKGSCPESDQHPDSGCRDGVRTGLQPADSFCAGQLCASAQSIEP